MIGALTPFRQPWPYSRRTLITFSLFYGMLQLRIVGRQQIACETLKIIFMIM